MLVSFQWQCFWEGFLEGETFINAMYKTTGSNLHILINVGSRDCKIAVPSPVTSISGKVMKQDNGCISNKANVYLNKEK